MTNEEAKKALITGLPVMIVDVMSEKASFRTVGEIVYKRGKDGKIVVLLGLIDRLCNHSIRYCKAEDVQFVTTENVPAYVPPEQPEISPEAWIASGAT